MQNFLSFWIGLRYIRSRKSQRFLSLLSWISLIGMILGVCSLILVLSVMNGFQGELRGRLLNVMPHILVNAQTPIQQTELDDMLQRFSAMDGVNKAFALISGEAMLSANNRLRAVELQAINPSNNAIEQHILAGSWQAFSEHKYTIVLGASLARSLGLALNDKVTLMLPEVTITPFGARPRVKQFRLVAVFEVGADVDGSMAFIRLVDGDKLFGLRGQTEQIQLVVDDVVKAEATAFDIQQQVDATFNQKFTVSSWAEQRSQLFSAVKMEKMMVSFLLSLVILVAAFNLLSVLSMMVAEKRLDISVLRVMGLSRSQVMAIFFAQGMSLALVSLAVGTVIGVLLALNLSDLVSYLEGLFGFYIFDPSVFYITGLPSDLQLNDVVAIIFLSIILSALFCLYPAFRASSIKPIEAMRV